MLHTGERCKTKIAHTRILKRNNDSSVGRCKKKEKEVQFNIVMSLTFTLINGYTVTVAGLKKCRSNH